MTIYIALLRGINVGGKNKIKMAELREALATLGLREVQTYIQSGNVLFQSEDDEQSLRQRIEQEIEKTFGLSIKVILRTYEQLKNMVNNCPFTEKEISEAQKTAVGESLYVSMLLEKPQTEQLEKLKSYETEVEHFQIIGKDIFLLFRESIRNSKLAKQAEKLGVPTTVRNWKTVNKLVSMCNEMEKSMN